MLGLTGGTWFWIFFPPDLTYSLFQSHSCPKLCLNWRTSFTVVVLSELAHAVIFF